MSLWAVLLTGLFAGGASCAAVQGGLPSLYQRRRGRTPSRWGTFLAGKLASHVVPGAALGLLGDAVQAGPRVRAYMQIAAGILMLILALDLLGVAAVRRVVPAPPGPGRAWSGAAAGGAAGWLRGCSGPPPCSFPAASP